jgi:hypothetical protein
LFKTSESVKKLISTSEGFKLLNRHSSKVSDFDLVAFRLVSTSLFSLVYTITTPDGPVALRMDFYAFERKLTLSDIRVTHKWDNMLRLIDRATQLPAALSIGIKPNHPGPDQK